MHTPLRWRHNDHAGVSNHQPHGCLLNRLFRRRSNKTSKLRVTGLCAGNSPGTGEFPAEMASYAENVSIWWRHHDPSVNYFITGSAERFSSGRLHTAQLIVNWEFGNTFYQMWIKIQQFPHKHLNFKISCKLESLSSRLQCIRVGIIYSSQVPQVSS